MGQLVPLVYCLLTRKHRSIYRFLFTEIKSKLEQYDIEIGVESFQCDSEDAAIFLRFSGCKHRVLLFPFRTSSLGQNL